MMDVSGLALAAMVLVMVVMCGGMILGGAWAILRGRKRH
jgi:hypothetical protein